VVSLSCCRLAICGPLDGSPLASLSVHFDRKLRTDAGLMSDACQGSECSEAFVLGSQRSGAGGGVA
jgi:hypothetical protein